jgi:hypothetical protein
LSGSEKPPYTQAISHLPGLPTWTPPPEDLLDPTKNIFVDNTAIIPSLAKRSANLLIAPRRFGKSTLFELVCAFHELSHEEALRVFHEGTAVGKYLRALAKPKPHRKAIKLTFNFEAEGDTTKEVRASMVRNINARLKKEAKRHGVLDQLEVDDTLVDVTLDNLIYLLTTPELGPPAVLIDEFDFPAMIFLTGGAAVTSELYKARVDGLKPIFATLKNGITGNTVHSEFVTGINQLAWRGMTTAANNLELLTYLSSDLRPQLAFTWAQIELHFAEHIKAYCVSTGLTAEQLKAELTDMYDGYAFNPEDRDDLYNPWSVLKFFETGNLEPHWGMSAISAWLAGSVSADVVEALCPLDEALSVPLRWENLQLGASDPTKLTQTEQTVMLAHAGDLSIVRGGVGGLGGAEWQVKVPNTEVRSIVLPALLEKVYGLPPSILSEHTAKLLAAGKIGEVLELFAQAWSSQLVSAREEKVHFIETYLSGGIGRALADLGGRFPGILKFEGKILNEGGGKGRLDIAFTLLQQEKAARAKERKVTYVLEVKIVGDGVKQKGIATALAAAHRQGLDYAVALKEQRACGHIVVVGVVYSRSGELRSCSEVCVP